MPQVPGLFGEFLALLCASLRLFVLKGFLRNGKFVFNFRIQKAAFLILFFSSALPSFSQTEVSILKQYEDSLRNSAIVFETSPSNEERVKENQHFIQILNKVLAFPESYQYPFDSVKSLSKLTASDDAFRIYTWVNQTVDHSRYSFSGFVQMKPRKGKVPEVFLLTDSSQTIQQPETAKLGTDNWFGAYYFKFVPVKKSGKKYYTLLGWKGNDIQSTKKVIDALYFQGGKPVFSAAIFPSVNRKEKKNSRKYCRMIFEFSSSAVMSLRYDASREMIVFDHLSPPEPSMEGIFSTYGPDLSYDELKFNKGRWELLPDADERDPNAPDGRTKRKSKQEPIYEPK